jgi:hypothetical protein
VFVRFVVGADGQNHRELTGIVSEARLLRDRGNLSSDETARLEEAYEWLNDHLPVPPFASSGWSRDVVAWFKDDAEDSVRRMWEIVALLEEHGVPVRLLRSKNPGRILYEDEHQIVVEEWNRI